jgi:RNA polymerase sigma-70 factor, ECF subfamily
VQTEDAMQLQLGELQRIAGRYLLRRTDRDMAADVLSDVMLVVWRRRAEWPADLTPWVLRIAHNCLMNARRGERRRSRLTSSIAESLDRSSEAQGPDISDALSRLPSSDQEILRLWAWEDLSAVEIAGVLGIRASAAATRLSRAKARLREQLSTSGKGTDDSRTVVR